jgi:Flp pilus assembly protein CpaB
MATPAIPYPRALDDSSINYARAIFGLVVALVGAALVLMLYLRGQPHTVQVLKATHDLSPGTLLQASDLVSEAEPLSDDLAALVVPASDRNDVLGHPLGNGLARGLPLGRAQVLDVSQRIPDNMRVVALSITPEAAAGGQIVAGDDVEVLATPRSTGAQRAEAVTVAERVHVYAVGAQPQSNTFATAPGTGSPNWLSVLANAEQARAIAAARTTSDLQVNLLPPLRTDPASLPSAP